MSSALFTGPFLAPRNGCLKLSEFSVHDATHLLLLERWPGQRLSTARVCFAALPCPCPAGGGLDS